MGFNQKHYQEKLQAGEAKYKAKLEESRKGIDRQDRKAVEKFTEQLQSLSDSACYALATSLLRAEPRLEWLHPTGAYHPGEVRELVASLMTHHLRLAGRVGTVSQETPPSESTT